MRQDVFGKTPDDLERARKSFKRNYGEPCIHQCSGTHCSICSLSGRCLMYHFHTADTPCPDWWKCDSCATQRAA